MRLPGISILVLLFLSAPEINAQELYPVTGNVYDTETGAPVSNAGIIVPETLTGATTDDEGVFGLKLPVGKYTIIFSSLGYAEHKMKLQLPSTEALNLRIGLHPVKVGIEGVDIIGDLFQTERDNSITREPVSLLPAITRVSAPEIERQGAVTLTDAFKYVPGGWTETRGRKTKQFFSVRGQKYPYPDYSINGIWQKEFEETVYFFSALDIESVEIIRSSSALVKGLSGLSGVVDVKTRRPESETVSMMAKYGGMNSYVTNLQYGNKIGDLTFNTSAALFGTDGPEGRGGRERMANFHGYADWQLTRKTRIHAGATYIGGLREFVSIVDPGSPMIMNREEKFDPVRTLLSYFKINVEGDDGAVTEIQTSLAYRNSDHLSFDLNQQTTTLHPEEDRELGVNFLHSRPLSPSNTLRAGFIYNHWIAPQGKRYYAGRSANVHTWSGVIASEQKAGRFLFDGGIRFIGGHITEWGGFGIEGSSAGFQTVAPIENQAAPPEWQTVLGASFIISGRATVHYNLAGGTIAPRKGSLNNEGLTPGIETRIQHDLGFRYRANNRNEITISTFLTQRADAIQLSGDLIDPGNGLILELYENIDKRSYGLELAVKLNLPAAYSSLFANATLMKGLDMISGDRVNDDKMPNFIANAGVNFNYSGFDTNIYLNYTGPYTNNRFVRGPWIAENGNFPLGDFAAADFTAGYTFKNKFPARVFIEVKNILDRNYLTVAGYPDPGRVISSGMRVRLDRD